MSPTLGQYLIFCFFSLIGPAVIYLRIKKDRKKLETELAEKRADVFRVSSTRQKDNSDNFFLPKSKDEWFISQNRLSEVVSTDDEDTVCSTLEEVRRYSKRLEENNFHE